MTQIPGALVCPLDWGTGHATRCVPVIRKLLDFGFRVTLAADGTGHDFLRAEFPQLKMVRFPGTKIKYTTGKNLSLKLALQAPLFLYGIYREHLMLRKLIRTEQPAVLISDNRYGLWNKNVRCIFITHQVRVIIPGNWKILSGFINGILCRFIKKFDECWVPDEKENGGLAGILSHPPHCPFPVHYLGILSRFITTKPLSTDVPKPVFDFLVILSGPEPQRSFLEKIMMEKFRNSLMKGNIITGRIGEKNETFLTDTIKVLPHLDTGKMSELIIKSEVIICRPGYSSLMDLATLGKRAVLIPTPGQTEQEYLAQYLENKKLFFSMPQESFNPDEAIRIAKDYPGIEITNNLIALESRIRTLLPKTFA